MDGLACAFGGTLPYAATYLVGVTQAQLTGAIDSSLGVMDFWPYSFHCIALFFVFWIAIFTGFGRKYEDPEAEQKAHGVIDTL